MRVSVYGESNVLPPEDIRYALEWLCQELMPGGCEKLSVRVHMVDIGPDLARVFPVTIDTYTRFTLQLNHRKIKTARMLYLCLCHEAVHIWQFASRVLVDRENGVVQWWNIHCAEGTMGYHEQPWEIEAHIREKELYDKLKAHLDERAGRRRRRNATQLTPRRHGEIKRGARWLNVVLFEDGYVRYVVPTQSEAEADRMIDEWDELGKVKLSVMLGTQLSVQT